MSGVSRGANLAIARQFPWETLPHLCRCRDGAGRPRRPDRTGQSASRGHRLRPARGGTVFEDYVAENGISDRLTFAGGSFFTDPLPRPNVVLYGHILHDGISDQKQHLLRGRGGRAAPGSAGAVVVYDSIIFDARMEKRLRPDDCESTLLVEDFGVASNTPGHDCWNGMREAGFRDTRVEHLVGPDSMVIGINEDVRPFGWLRDSGFAVCQGTLQAEPRPGSALDHGAMRRGDLDAAPVVAVTPGRIDFRGCADDDGKERLWHGLLVSRGRLHRHEPSRERTRAAHLARLFRRRKNRARTAADLSGAHFRFERESRIRDFELKCGIEIRDGTPH